MMVAIAPTPTRVSSQLLQTRITMQDKKDPQPMIAQVSLKWQFSIEIPLAVSLPLNSRTEPEQFIIDAYVRKESIRLLKNTLEFKDELLDFDYTLDVGTEPTPEVSYEIVLDEE